MNDTRPSNWRELWNEQIAEAREKFACALAENPKASLSALSKIAGCSENTAHKWKKRMQGGAE